ncbi:hypothetical protein DPMN_093106 [Dreissena polymorpha]|uniref:Uncharacterized protein n=1 Tax=Dreissena polymorpha TaxID=45954 RepID=A0A9D4R0M5_DREPO|nr:hypothetical protein DPMN_093106 [Dreissena polymorpha]
MLGGEKTRVWEEKRLGFGRRKDQGRNVQGEKRPEILLSPQVLEKLFFGPKGPKNLFRYVCFVPKDGIFIVPLSVLGKVLIHCDSSQCLRGYH